MITGTSSATGGPTLTDRGREAGRQAVGARRADPFRELDRLTEQVFGTAARPVAMPIDAYREGDEFLVHVDLPGVHAR